MKMAIAHHLIQHNPMDIVLHIQHETEHGSALTTEKTAILFQTIKRESYERLITLPYYTGLHQPFRRTFIARGRKIPEQNQ